RPQRTQATTNTAETAKHAEKTEYFCSLRSLRSLRLWSFLSFAFLAVFALIVVSSVQTLPQNFELAYPVRHEDAAARPAACRGRRGQLGRHPAGAKAGPEVDRVRLVDRRYQTERLGRRASGD